MVLRISRARPIVVAIQFIRRAKPLRSQRISAHISSSHARGAVARAPEERNEGGSKWPLPERSSGRGRLLTVQIPATKGGRRHRWRRHPFDSDENAGWRRSCEGCQGLPATPPVNNDGVLGTYETNWTVRDTDGDRLWDGFDYVVDPSGPSWHYGELYLQDYNNRLFFQNAHQSADTNATVADTDGDGLEDGEELFCWYHSLVTDQPSSDPTYSNLTSDPSLSDTDGDNLNDYYEYTSNSHPLITDTDLDGLRDKAEYDYGTDPCDFDTDGDMIPDGWVEDWWRGSDGEWSIDSGSNNDGDSTPNYWEGEDLNLDGDQDTGETDADDSDSDDDGIKDGYEFFYNYVFAIMDPTGSVDDFDTGEEYWDADGDDISNALETDSDDDGLTDDLEDLNCDGAFEGTEDGGSYPLDYDTAFEANPYDDDTDGDGVNDNTDWTVDSTYYFEGDFDNDNRICVADNDSDGDGVDDDTDTTITYGATTDDDGDGLTGIQEEAKGTDPYDADTDDDGLYDGWVDSINPNLNVWDSGETYGELGDLNNNGDGGYGTKPKNPDSDGDGLDDNLEVNVDFNSDPNDKDTDNDGLDDKGEYDNEADPNLADTDGDTLTDYQEVAMGTEPDDPDTDDDGLTDGPHSNWGFSLSLFNAGTVVSDYTTAGFGPLTALPSDKVVLSDGEDQNANGIVDYIEEDEYFETDPANKYTDPDGWTDGYEVAVSNTKAAGPGANDDDDDDEDDDDDPQPQSPDLYLTVRVSELVCYDEDIEGNVDNAPDMQTIISFYEKVDSEYIPAGTVVKNYPTQMYTVQADRGSTSNKLNQDTQYVKVSIEMWERDTSTSDDHLDINPDLDSKNLNLLYDFHTGIWCSLELNPFTAKPYEGSWIYEDSNGEVNRRNDIDGAIGFSTGLRTSTTFYRKGAISFDIYPSNVYGDLTDDGDGLTVDAENFWGLQGDDYDSDDDALPDCWEVKHDLRLKGGIDPEDDFDNDGIQNGDECYFRYYGANPNREDIFVEVDWMYDAGGEGVDCSLPETSQFFVIRSFAKHSISLHIDDGRFNNPTFIPKSNRYDYDNYLFEGKGEKGGGWIDYDDETIYTNKYWGFNEIENNPQSYQRSNILNYKWGMDGTPNNPSEDQMFSINRFRVFHYCLINANDMNNNAEGPGDDFTMSLYYGGVYSNELIGKLFMHELGHNLGLPDGNDKNGDGKNDPDNVMVQGLSPNFDYDVWWNAINLDNIKKVGYQNELYDWDELKYSEDSDEHWEPSASNYWIWNNIM